jgi:uncharacterized protein YjiS (DUF1127 family)
MDPVFRVMYDVAGVVTRGSDAARTETQRMAAERERRAAGPSLWSVADAALAKVATTLFAWVKRARQRRELLGLSDHDLHDFGASRCDAAGEGSKPFWRT